MIPMTEWAMNTLLDWAVQQDVNTQRDFSHFYVEETQWDSDIVNTERMENIITKFISSRPSHLSE